MMQKTLVKKVSGLGAAALLSLFGVIAAGPVHASEDRLAGVFVRSDGWVLTSSRGLEGCGTIVSARYGPALATIEDPGRKLRLLRFEASGVPALVLNSRPRLEQRVSIIRAARTGGLEVGETSLSALTSLKGDATVLRSEYRRNSPLAAHFVLDHRARLIGLVSGWRDQGETARITASAYVSMLLNAHGVRGGKKVKAGRIEDSLVDLTCATDPEGGAEDFTRETLDRFGARAWAEAFAEVYQSVWSAPNAVALEFVSGVYAPRVDYFGKSFSRAEVMRDKANFARRWDYRSYAFRDEVLDISCQRKRCRVTGVNDFFTYSSALNKTSTGVAKFSFDLDLESLAITRESSSVLSRGSADPTGMFRDWANAQQSCVATAGEAACQKAEYLEVVMEAFGHCITKRRPKGKLMEIGACN